MRNHGMSLARAFLVVALLFGLSAAPAEALERFSYCGTLRVTGGLQTPNGTVMPTMPAIPLAPYVGGYVGPIGITPVPPRSCVYVDLGRARNGLYRPTIVVWSDLTMPMPYHADIYADPEGIFGHRLQQPSDFEPSEVMSRTREMEAFLEAAAGKPVLLAVLDALRQGHERTSFDRDLIPVFLGNAAGEEITLSGRYEITEIRANPEFSTEINELIREGRKRRHPHSPEWKPVTIPAEKVP